jgi:fructosamine-3-kinase
MDIIATAIICFVLGVVFSKGIRHFMLKLRANPKETIQAEIDNLKAIAASKGIRL